MAAPKPTFPGDYRYGVCVTETGSSITANGLKIIGKLFESNTVLIANPDAAAR